MFVSWYVLVIVNLGWETLVYNNSKWIFHNIPRVNTLCMWMLDVTVSLIINYLFNFLLWMQLKLAAVLTHGQAMLYVRIYVCRSVRLIGRGYGPRARGVGNDWHTPTRWVRLWLRSRHLSVAAAAAAAAIHLPRWSVITCCLEPARSLSGQQNTLLDFKSFSKHKHTYLCTHAT